MWGFQRKWFDYIVSDGAWLCFFILSCFAHSFMAIMLCISIYCGSQTLLHLSVDSRNVPQKIQVGYVGASIVKPLQTTQFCNSARKSISSISTPAKSTQLVAKPTKKQKNQASKHIVSNNNNKVVKPTLPPQLPLNSKADKKICNNIIAQQKQSSISNKVSSIMCTAQDQKEYFQTLITREWKPPVGIKPKTSCILKMVIDNSGKIDSILVEKSSGILIFDIAARTALSNIEIPRLAWNTTLSITFT